MTTFTMIIAKALSKFNKPDSPYLSPIIRTAGQCAYLFASFTFWLTTLYAITIFVLFEAANLLSARTSDGGLIDVIILGLIELWSATHNIFELYLAGLMVGILTALPFILRFIPQWERSEGLHEIEDYVAKFKSLKSFDPLSYINLEKGCFVGLDLNNKPIYIPFRKIRETHAQVTGNTGSGKGVLITLIAYQCILAGESVIWFDPKYDRFAPRLLHKAAKLAGKKFHMVNLNPEQPPQLNPLEDAHAYEIEELLVAGFDLVGKGTDGDFHRGKDDGLHPFL